MMTAEQNYEYQSLYQSILDVQAQIDEQEEAIEMEQHMALVENREAQLLGYYVGLATLKDRLEALQAKF